MAEGGEETVNAVIGAGLPVAGGRRPLIAKFVLLGVPA